MFDFVLMILCVIVAIVLLVIIERNYKFKKRKFKFHLKYIKALYILREQYQLALSEGVNLINARGGEKCPLCIVSMSCTKRDECYCWICPWTLITGYTCMKTIPYLYKNPEVINNRILEIDEWIKLYQEDLD
jgi:hypothetical protein